MFTFVLAQLLLGNPCRRVQDLVPFLAIGRELSAFLDCFRSTHKSGLQLAPDRADHENQIIRRLRRSTGMQNSNSDAAGAPSTAFCAIEVPGAPSKPRLGGSPAPRYTKSCT
jgi:hypothetical protein